MQAQYDLYKIKKFGLLTYRDIHTTVTDWSIRQACPLLKYNFISN